MAAERGDIVLAERLLAAGANPNAVVPSDKRFVKGRHCRQLTKLATPLTIARASGATAVVELLRAAGGKE